MTMQTPDPIPARRNHQLAEMSAAYFGLVMSTGIVSLAAWLLGHPHIANGLFLLNIAQFLVLALLYCARAWRYPHRFFGGLISHRTGSGYFTLVAGTAIVASQFLILKNHTSVGAVLWVTSMILWVVLTYTFFLAVMVRRDKPSIERGIDGSWLLSVVAAQALSVSGMALGQRLDQSWRLEFEMMALAFWLWGIMLYIWLMSLIFYRYILFRISPRDLAPPYWIDMGAMAISTLAGAQLVLSAPGSRLLTPLLPFLQGLTIFCWATSTWWIPMLVLLAVWRYGYERFPLGYDPLDWSAVFPLGMYAAATWQLDQALDLGYFQTLSRIFLWAALAAWGITYLGMLHMLTRNWRIQRSP